MSKIILVPIEPLPERYSTDWLKWFLNEFEELGVEYTLINPKPLTSTITQGSFLDVCGTNYYKALQIAEISRLIHEGDIGNYDTFLFLDGWFPGVESLAYMRDALGMTFKITCCMHAGTYDKFDFLSKKGMGRWGKDLENSWFEIYDKIFVATQFHKSLLYRNRDIYKQRVIITGFPIYPINANPNAEKSNIVVFPHRLDSEKNPDKFDELKERLTALNSDWSFVRSKDICSNKQEYYHLLCNSKIAVSFADQETWGIAMQEAVLCGCIPVVPNKLSYREMYSKSFKYDTFEECADIVQDIMNGSKASSYDRLVKEQQTKILHSGYQAIPNMIREIEDGE